MPIDDEDFDNLVRREKIGLEAQERWSDVASRIADALEHQVIAGMLMQMAAMGKDARLDSVKHRQDCPACAVTRQLINAIKTQSAIMPVNGAMGMARRK